MNENSHATHVRQFSNCGGSLPVWVYLLIVIGLSGCSTTTAPGPAITPLPEVNQEAARKILHDTDASFAKLMEKKGPAQALYEFLAPEGTVLLTGELPIKGRDAVRVHFSALPAGRWSFKPLGTEVSREADLGYTWGEYEIKNQRAGYGKYLSVWRKQPNGSWRIAVHATNSSPPPNERR